MFSSIQSPQDQRTPKKPLARWPRRGLRLGLAGTAGMLLFVLVCNLWVQRNTQSLVYTQVKALPSNPVGLVLGTSSRFPSGRPNLFFQYRMEAAIQAYRKGKVNHLLLSGDNRHPNYNEPLEMKRYLMKSGIPEKAITLDHAGLRTLDSVVRAKKIFGQNQLTIISQRAHVERALFIADHHKIQAVALAAKDVPIGMSLKTRVREWLARCKAVLDLYILNTQPSHLGKPEPILNIHSPTSSHFQLAD